MSMKNVNPQASLIFSDQIIFMIISSNITHSMFTSIVQVLRDYKNNLVIFPHTESSKF